MVLPKGRLGKNNKKVALSCQAQPLLILLLQEVFRSSTGPDASHMFKPKPTLQKILVLSTPFSWAIWRVET